MRRAAEDSGDPLPEEFIAPEIPIEAAQAYAAAKTLAGEAGSYPLHDVQDGQLKVFNQRGSIPFTAIDAYARRYDIDGDEFDRLLYFIRIIEGVQRRSGTS